MLIIFPSIYVIYKIIKYRDEQNNPVCVEDCDMDDDNYRKMDLGKQD